MRPLLLIDFGSTYTKVTAVDPDQEAVIGTASAFTTVATDIGEGLDKALLSLESRTGKLDFESRLACSSAAGGLAMMVSGLVPELTAEAARMAALGAGARISRVFSHELSDRDLVLIMENLPDIFLLTGGTDGGNREVITGNAEKLASLPVRFPLIYAGNRSALDDCEKILSDFPLIVCPNVMPRLGQLLIEPVQKEIRKLFLSRIVHGRGLSSIRELLSGILMPTPSAILAAMTLLSQGTKTEEGWGDLLAIDVGGATTDVYSIGRGEPDDVNIIYKGFPEPLAKRTVEGDIGVRYSFSGIVDELGLEGLAQRTGLAEGEIQKLLADLMSDRSLVPGTPDDQLCLLDHALASGAVDLASRRHAGCLEEVYTPMGPAFVQTGKNLRSVGRIILTGGSLIHSAAPLDIARAALYSPAHPMSLRPLEAEAFRDDRYILSAMGVLAEKEPDLALRIMKKELVSLGHCRQNPN